MGKWQAPIVETTKQLPKTLEEKWKTLKSIEKQFNKQFDNEASMMRLGDKVGIVMPSISTGLYSFDYNVAGIGGIPKGRIIEVIGPESSGKTTFTLHVIAEEQKRKNICAFIDAEHAVDINYAQQLGVDIDNLVVSQPNSGEEALSIVEALVDSGAVSLIVIDSVAALVPRAELEGDFGESHMGLQARLLSQSMRKLRGKCNLNQVTLIFINQIREKIGVTYGSNETTTGGRALKFYASLRLDIRKTELIKEENVVVGHVIRIKGIKNKVANPFRETLLNLYYGKGFDKHADLVDYAASLGVIEKVGGWFKLNGESYRKDDVPFDKIKELLNART